MSIIIVLLKYLLQQSRIKLIKLLDQASDDVIDRLKQKEARLTNEPKNYQTRRRLNCNYSFNLQQSDIESPGLSQGSKAKSYSSHTSKLAPLENPPARALPSISKLLSSSERPLSNDFIRILYGPIGDLDVNHFSVQINGIKERYSNDR
jgi:hypothetical protein